MASSEEVKNETMREFATGATRNVDTERIDPEGFLSPAVLAEYFKYMHKNRFQKDGNLRDSDNWQLGIPQRAYVKSLWRHFFDFWTRHRAAGNHKSDQVGYRNEQLIEDCCALMFNSMGYMFEELKKSTKGDYFVPDSVPKIGLQELLKDGRMEIQGITYNDGRSHSALIDRTKREIYYGKTQSSMLKNQLIEDCSNDLDEPGYGGGI